MTRLYASLPVPTFVDYTAATRGAFLTWGAAITAARLQTNPTFQQAAITSANTNLKAYIRSQRDQELIAYTIQWLKNEAPQAQNKVSQLTTKRSSGQALTLTENTELGIYTALIPISSVANQIDAVISEMGQDDLAAV